MNRGSERGFTKAILGAAVLLVILQLAGCSFFKNASRQASAPAMTKQQEQGPSPLYYDFGDVLIPSELKVDRKSSFVFRTPGMSAGVLSLKGRVEGESLITFFENNMVKDNWQPISSFKSPRTIMLFKKENRWCVINILEGDYNTSVEIWVAPNINQPEAGLLK